MKNCWILEMTEYSWEGCASRGTTFSVMPYRMCLSRVSLTTENVAISSPEHLLRRRKSTKEQRNLHVQYSTAPPRRPKRSIEKDVIGRFPTYCMICKKEKNRIRKGDHEYNEYPTKFTLQESVDHFQKAANAREDKDMLDAIDGKRFHETWILLEELYQNIATVNHSKKG